jgi:hypothetical protein
MRGCFVRLRFRFGSDGYVTYEGWYIDDIVLVPTADEAAGIEADRRCPRAPVCWVSLQTRRVRRRVFTLRSHRERDP